MNFGLSFLPDASPAVKSPAAYFEDALALAVAADQGGLSHVKMTEHYLHPYGGYCPSPLMFLAAVAMRTTRIRLMTGCILAAFHHPVQIAAHAAMADVLSGGRIDIGFARAFLPYEFEAFGVPIDESRSRFEAVIQAVVRLWREKCVNEETPYFHLRDAESYPPPVQRPHPPVWCAAIKSRQSFAWIGEQGYGLLVALSVQSLADLREHIAIYRESHAARHSGPGRVTMLMPLYLAPDDGSAREEGDSFLQRYHDIWIDAASAWDRMQSSAYPGYTGIASQLRRITPAQLREGGNTAFGSPARIVDQIGRMKEDLGVDTILWNIDFGAMPFDRSMRTLNLFIEQVHGSLRI